MKVYRYDYYDKVLKRDRRSVDYATADAITAMGGTLLGETEKVVDDDLVDNSGIIRAMDAFMERPSQRHARSHAHHARPR